MNIHLATWLLADDQRGSLDLVGHWSRLSSFYELSHSKAAKKKTKKVLKDMKKTKKQKPVDLFIDSGAFSAFTQNTEINIDEYIAFIKKHQDVISVYANLDDIVGGAEPTLANQRYMESKGLNPLPCFHYNEPWEYLEQYIEEYEYISLGGMVPISTGKLREWLDQVFGEYICDNEGMPKVKVHGFGMTSLKLMLRYPWYSVDSTSWVISGRLGSIYTPVRKNGKWSYDDAWKIAVSAKSPASKEAGKHLSTLSKMERGIFMEYIASRGFVLGRSEYRWEDEAYTLEEGEKWAGKAEHGEREVETIIEAGISNDYRIRDQINIIYFQELEKHCPEWPWPFKHVKSSKGFGL